MLRKLQGYIVNWLGLIQESVPDESGQQEQ